MTIFGVVFGLVEVLDDELDDGELDELDEFCFFLTVIIALSLILPSNDDNVTSAFPVFFHFLQLIRLYLNLTM